MSLKITTHNMLSCWGKWTLSHPYLVLLLISLLSALGWEYTVTHLSINTDTADFIAPDAPFQKNRRKFENAFSQEMHTLLLVVESDTPELTKSATTRLGRLLGADKDNFSSVYLPNGHDFFRRNGLLYLDVKDLQSLSANLAQAQPFIGRISIEPDLTGFFSIFEDALDTANQGQTVPIDLSSLIDKVSKALHKSVNGVPSLLSWEGLISDNKPKVGVPKNGFIIVLPKFDYSRIRPAETAIAAVRKAVAQIQEPNLPPVKVWLTGEVGLEDDELLGMSTGTFNASIFSVVLVAVILLVAYRSVWLAIATLISLTLGMIFSGAFAAYSVSKLNLISLAFAVSNIGLGVEYAIHFCLRYRDNLLHHIEKERALHSTLMSTSPSLILCASTTAIGLYAFIPTDYKGVSELGLLAGTSLFICLFVALITLPALLTIIPASVTTAISTSSVSKSTVISRFSEKLAKAILHYARSITVATFLLAVVSTVLVLNVITDFNPINLRDPNTESVIAFKNLMKEKETSPMTLTVLAKDEQETKTLQQKLSAIGTVDSTISLFDFVPTDRGQKLAIIEELATILGTQANSFPELKPDDNPGIGIGRLITKIDKILPEKTNAREIEILTAFKKELQDILIEILARQEPSRHQFIEQIQTTLLGTLPNAMNELYAGFNAKEITLADIPPAIKERWLSKDGWYRIQIVPKKDLNNLADMQQFITDVQAIAPETTDLPIMYWESMKEVIAAFQQAIGIALFTIAVLLYAIRRNVTDTLLVMAPLILAGLFTMASTVVTHTPINFANIIALPLLLGLGVDNGIHMVEKLRHSLSDEQNIYQSSTSRAIFYGALTTVSSFVGLAFSPHQGIASMGLIITIGIFWIMVCTFVILPALSKLVLKRTVS
jgi:uncharacterized protein